jgi:hypothetical protein
MERASKPLNLDREDKLITTISFKKSGIFVKLTLNLFGNIYN